VIGWHRQGFRRYWAWKSRPHGRPRIRTELRDLIQRMSRANPLRGAPRIHRELLKLGLTVSQATVSKYMLRPRRPPSQAWRAFLKNHARDLIALDFFTVPTATFRLLFVLVVLTQPAPVGAFQCHGAPDCGMDGAATARGVHARGEPSVFDPGSRRRGWGTIFASSQDARHPGSDYCAARAVAKRLCRAGDCLDTTRIS
jgi:hypothetical protein